MKPFPGKPQAQLQAVCTALWDGRRIVAYIAGDALVILGGVNDLIQTIKVDGGGGGDHGRHAKLSAVAMHDVTGKIATSTGNCVCIYKPFGQDFGAPKWALEHTFHTAVNEDDIWSLSWGLAEELLVGGSTLTLFSTHSSGVQVWSRDIANPVKFAALSPDGSFIATTGWHDRLVKIWRRLYFSEENERFDISYLPHSAAVTELRWHGRRDPEYHAEAILYTTSADHKLRVWAATETHGLQALQLWAELDLTQSMSPEIRPKTHRNAKRYAFVIDNWEYEALVERVTHRSSNTEKDQEMLKRLVDVAYRDPDICIVLDDQGNMSAWGLERIGCKARQENNVFKIAQVSGVDVHAIEDVQVYEDYATCLSFGGQGDGCEVNLLINFFDGRLQWLTCSVDRLFYADASAKSFTTEAVFTGHTEVIEGFKPSYTGSAVISRSADKEIVLWRYTEHLQRAGSIPAQEAVKIALPLLSGAYAVTVDDRDITLWDTQKSEAAKLSSQKLPADFNAIDCAVLGGETPTYILVTTNNLAGTLFSITNSVDGQPEFLEQVCPVPAVDIDRCAIFHLVPAPSNIQALSAVSITSSGLLVCWTLNIQPDQESCVWESKESLDTGIRDIAVVAANSNLKAVLLDPPRTTLTIWNIPERSLEYYERYSDHDSVENIEWTSSPDGVAVLAVAFSHKIVLYAQLPYELSVAGVSDAWTRLREVNISELTNLPISQCAWLAGGNLLLTAGNQMFAIENEIDGRTAHDLGLPTRSKIGHEVYNVVSAMNSTLPAFHPQFLRQLILAGIFELVHMILATLNNTLKFHAPGDKLDSFLKLDIMSLAGRQSTVEQNHKQAYSHSGVDDDTLVVTEDLATALKDRLTGFHLPHIPASQRDELIRLTDSIGKNQKQQQSVDYNGFQYLTLSREHFTQPLTAGEPTRQLSSREMVLAYRSISQEVLLDATSQQYKGRILWKDAKECGMFLWMTDLPALVRIVNRWACCDHVLTLVQRAQFENVARNEYTKTDERNPIDCSLHYIALRKKAVLISLWRMATWNKEQSATQRLLTNNFADPKWQTTAIKNAYALLGRRRFGMLYSSLRLEGDELITLLPTEYAAAFFLLADRVKDAANVLATQLKDIQLAIAVTRVYEGDDGPVLKQLLQDKVLPLAAQQGDRWLAHWAFDMIGRRDLAMRCLAGSLIEIIDVKLTPAQIQEALHFRNSDPALLFYYRQLRDLVVPPGQDPYPALEPAEEWDFIMRTVRTYMRAGCAVLALTIGIYPRPLVLFPFHHPTSADIPQSAHGASSRPMFRPHHKPAPGRLFNPPLHLHNSPSSNLQPSTPSLGHRAHKPPHFPSHHPCSTSSQWHHQQCPFHDHDQTRAHPLSRLRIRLCRLCLTILPTLLRLPSLRRASKLLQRHPSHQCSTSSQIHLRRQMARMGQSVRIQAQRMGLRPRPCSTHSWILSALVRKDMALHTHRHRHRCWMPLRRSSLPRSRSLRRKLNRRVCWMISCRLR